MSRFATNHQALGAPALQEHLGETVSYTPSGGDAVSITAVVNRDTLEAQGADGQARLAYAFSILVSKADVATVVTGADTVALKKRAADAANTTFRVTSILNQYGGMWELGLN